MDYDVIKDCTTLSDEEKITFPEVVRRLSNAGIDMYYADLLVPNKTYYADNTAHTIPCSLVHDKKVSDNFNKENVQDAIRQIQSGTIQYQEFLKRIMDAGVISYLVFIKGRKALYLGKKGEQHIEEFPK